MSIMSNGKPKHGLRKLRDGKVAAGADAIAVAKDVLAMASTNSHNRAEDLAELAQAIARAEGHPTKQPERDPFTEQLTPAEKALIVTYVLRRERADKAEIMPCGDVRAHNENDGWYWVAPTRILLTEAKLQTSPSSRNNDV